LWPFEVRLCSCCIGLNRKTNERKIGFIVICLKTKLIHRNECIHFSHTHTHTKSFYQPTYTIFFFLRRYRKQAIVFLWPYVFEILPGDLDPSFGNVSNCGGNRNLGCLCWALYSGVQLTQVSGDKAKKNLPYPETHDVNQYIN
jgi:hypothetical protein